MFRARRMLGVLALSALLVVPATMAEAATHKTPVKSSRAHTSVSRAKTTRGKTARKGAVTTRRSGRGRRARHLAPPPGGVYSRNAILVDPSTGKVLFEKNAGRSVPIASLTKLMTALVFLEQKPDLSRDVEVTQAELQGAGHTQLRNHEVVALGDLLHMSLMCSDNVATRVLARESGLEGAAFVARMNRKADELGLEGTQFVEFTGLDERNVSTAAGVARMLHAAAHQPLIQQITTTREYEFRTESRVHAIRNTDRLLYGHWDVLGGKTGFISEAGYCFATWIRSQGRDFIAVVLGAPTAATRFADAVRLINRTTTTAMVAP